MEKQFPVRYGRNYKVILAIVLPAITIWPFIEAMQYVKHLEEWLVWVIIFAFLGIMISFSIWLAMRVYPPATMSINKYQVSLEFDPSNFLSPSGFTFTIADITSFTGGAIGGDEYFVIQTQNPMRKFQISASSYRIEDTLDFNEAMAEISEKIRKE